MPEVHHPERHVRATATAEGQDYRVYQSDWAGSWQGQGNSLFLSSGRDKVILSLFLSSGRDKVILSLLV